MKKFYKLIFKKKSNIKSFIDNISSCNLCGWVYQKDVSFSEIRFLIGNNLIANTKINILREDVNRSLKINENLLVGYSLDLKYKEEFKNYKGEPRLIVFQTDGSLAYDLLKDKKNNSLKNKLNSFFKDNIIGINGQVFYYKDVGFNGWAFRDGEIKPIDIWVKCDSFDPIKIKCDQEISQDNIKRNIGFLFPKSNIPIDWINKEINFYYDKNGLYKIPEASNLVLDENTGLRNINLEIKNDNSEFISSKNLSINEYSHVWKDIENSKNFVNEINKRLDLIENKKRKKKFIIF